MRRIRKTFKRPKKAWDLARIKEEKILLSNYGLRKKRELWKAEEILRGFRRRARDLIASEDEGQERILLGKLSKFGLLSKGMDLDDVLALTVNDVLERRLQTVIFRKGLVKSIDQARQMIVHGHVSVDGKRVVFPSYLVPLEEEKGVRMIKEGGK
ncbi:MAG: 30S ribosomal protein S4 [Candidatus Aenigmatarchaeota archaeon]|nr:MAG: 30S ribosomal protein S4 [Candidatus Aenigmarchaeota archaeon]